jgi:hypothetical protein
VALLGIIVIIGLMALVLRQGIRAGTGPHPFEPSRPQPVDLQTIPWSDAGFLSRWTEGFTALGFTPLIDFELPHTNVPHAKACYRTLISSDGAIVATLTQRLVSGAVTETASLMTWFEDGCFVATNNSTAGEPRLDRKGVVVTLPRVQDPNVLRSAHDHACRRFVEKGSSPRRLRDATSFGDQLGRFWRERNDAAIGGGYATREGESVRMRPGFLARWVAWTLYGPVALGRSALFHFAVIGTSVLAAAGVESRYGHEVGRFLGNWAVDGLLIGVGGLLGHALRTNGFVWCFVAANAALLARGMSASSSYTYWVLFGWLVEVGRVSGKDARRVDKSS